MAILQYETTKMVFPVFNKTYNGCAPPFCV